MKQILGLFGARQIGCLVSVGAGQIISIKKPGVSQQFPQTDVIDALNEIASDCEATHEAMFFCEHPEHIFSTKLRARNAENPAF